MTTEAPGPPSPPRRFPRAIALGALAVSAASCLVFVVSTRVVANPPAWYTFEFCQYAEIGKNLAESGRFATRLVEPMALAVLDAEPPERRGSGDLWPVVNRYPLPCWVVAALMRVVGPTDMAASWSNGLAMAVLGAAGFVAAARWFGVGWGVVFAVLFLANPAFFAEFVLLGTPDPWFAAVFLIQLLVWVEFDPKADSARPRWGWALALGVLSGLAFLARFNATMLLGWQMLALLRWRRWRELAVVAAVALAVASPMLVYNLRHFGRLMVSIYSAWNLLDGIGAYRVEPWLYYRVPRLWVELAAHLDGVGRKLGENLGIIIPTRIWNLWRLIVVVPVALFATAFGRPKGTAEGRFAAWATGLFLFQLVSFAGLRLELERSVSPHHGRYFFWYAVPAVLIALGLAKRLTSGSLRWWPTVAGPQPAAKPSPGHADELDPPRRPGRSPGGRFGRACAIAAVTASLLIQLASFAPAWAALPAAHAERTNLGHDPIRDMIRRVAEGRVVASNQPQMTAWFCGLRSISLPADLNELQRLNRESPTPVDFVFVDLNYNCIDLDPSWQQLASRQPGVSSIWEPGLLDDYEYVIPANRTRGLEYVLLRRRAVRPNAAERAVREQVR